jgi:high-affinity Fe2+/Pb2+ permease
MTERDDARGSDNSRAPTVIYRVLLGVCAALTLADLVYEKHVHFGFEGWFGVYGFYGFVACVGLVLVAKELRRVLKRREDYYE